MTRLQSRSSVHDRIIATALVLLLWMALSPAVQAGPEPALIVPRAAQSLLVDITRAGAHLVAVGERGHILVSPDEGKSWRQVAVPVDVLLTAVHFATASEGWAVGHDGIILHSRDGGEHWEIQRNAAANGEYAPPLLDTWFRDAQEGWAVGAFGLVLHTTNGGKDWQDISGRIDNPEGLHCNAVIGLRDGSVLIAGERGLVVASHDQGTSWQRLPFPYDGSLFGVLASAQQVLVFGLRGHAFRSLDGGAHWQAVTLPSPQTLAGGVVSGDGRIFLVGQGGTVLAGDPDAQDFRILQQGQRYHLAGVAVNADATQLLVSGQGGIHTLPLAAGAAP